MEDMELNNLDTENLRIPPHNNDAETSALGAMLLSKEAITLSIEIISVEDFYSPAHQKFILPYYLYTTEMKPATW